MTVMITPFAPYVLWEDNHLILAYKKAGLLSQSDGYSQEDMVENLKLYLKVSKNKPGEVYLGLLHRLDRPVAGLMLLAKTSKAAARLSKQIQEHSLGKMYLAVCHGKLEKEEEVWEDYLKKDPRTQISSLVDAKDKEAKWAKLSYRLLAYNKERDESLVWIHLHTGRHHQIRLQFSSRSHPLVYDHRYGTMEDRKSREDIALSSVFLAFKHPVKTEIQYAYYMDSKRSAFRFFPSSAFEKARNYCLEAEKTARKIPTLPTETKISLETLFKNLLENEGI